jgi:hypothetical protein
VIRSLTFMLIVVQSRDGFRPIDALPKEMTFNADCYISYILKSLGQMFTDTRNPAHRKLIVHTENTKPHRARQSSELCDQKSMKTVLIHPSHLIWPFRFLAVWIWKGSVERTGIHGWSGSSFCSQRKFARDRRIDIGTRFWRMAGKGSVMEWNRWRRRRINFISRFIFLFFSFSDRSQSRCSNWCGISGIWRMD